MTLPVLSILGKNHQRSDVIYVYTARPLSINNGIDCRVFSKGAIESILFQKAGDYPGDWAKGKASSTVVLVNKGEHKDQPNHRAATSTGVATMLAGTLWLQR